MHYGLIEKHAESEPIDLINYYYYFSGNYGEGN